MKGVLSLILFFAASAVLPAQSMLRQVPRVASLNSIESQQQLANIALASLQLSASSTAHLRHIIGSVYRQIKLTVDSPFYRNLQTSMDDYANRLHSAGVRSIGSPDVFSCHSLVRTAHDMSSGVDKEILDEYLEWMIPGTPRGEYEVKGCWVEPVANAPFQRLIFTLDNKHIENVVVKALEASGCPEVIGTRGPGSTEAAADKLIESFLSSIDENPDGI